MEALEATIIKEEILDLLFCELFREATNKDLEGSLLNFGRYNTQGCAINDWNRPARLYDPQFFVIVCPPNSEVDPTKANPIELDQCACLFNRAKLNENESLLSIDKGLKDGTPRVDYASRSSQCIDKIFNDLLTWHFSGDSSNIDFSSM